MRIRSADLYRLIEESWDKLTLDYNENFKSMNAKFFDRLALCIQEESKNKYKLKGATLYKQYYLKVKEDSTSSQSDFIGVTPIYLSALSHFLYNKPFEEIGITPLSETQDEIPEFPHYHASFPATPTIPLQLSLFKDSKKLKDAGFSKSTNHIILQLIDNYGISGNTLWYKDESINPNGTHKDRMAWEIYLWYDMQIKRQMNTPGRKISLKSLSLISSGSAAYSVQQILRDRGFPNLRVLMDRHTPKKLIDFLREQDCKVYLEDLDLKEYDSNDILSLTDNINGLDLTYSSEFDSNREVYYDWLSYEVLNQNPDWVFVPFGTGELYKNILKRNSKEMDKKISSKRFFGDKKVLMNCNFMGASNNNKSSKMKMLYSKFQNNTINEVNKNLINSLKEKKHCGGSSSVNIVKEKYLEMAIEVANYFLLNYEPSGISGLGLFFQLIDSNDIIIGPNDKIIIINTGKSITSQFY